MLRIVTTGFRTKLFRSAKPMIYTNQVRSFNYKWLNSINANAEEDKKHAQDAQEAERKEQLRQKLIKQYGPTLTPMQFDVAFDHGTEPPFQNKYHDEKREGIYKSIVLGEPLFSSKDKFDSGTGWPSFTKPIDGAPVKETQDYQFGMVRTEVSCITDCIHLGHVFDDGPTG